MTIIIHKVQTSRSCLSKINCLTPLLILRPIFLPKKNIFILYKKNNKNTTIFKKNKYLFFSEKISKSANIKY